MKQKCKYYRKCGICGAYDEQSEMIRTEESSTGWVCEDCYYANHTGYKTEEGVL